MFDEVTSSGHVELELIDFDFTLGMYYLHFFYALVDLLVSIAQFKFQDKPFLELKGSSSMPIG